MIKKYVIARYTYQWIPIPNRDAADEFHSLEIISGEWDTIEEAEAQLAEIFNRDRGEQCTILPLYYHRLG